MQGAETENQAKSRNDEDSINFRPSPNFKHMKKYLKSKFEEASQAMINTSSQQGTPDASSKGHNKQEKANKTQTTPEVQPPLPPNPPPPDTPLIVNLKQEIEDDEYNSNTENGQSDYNLTNEINANSTIKTDQSETEKAEVTMCRNYVRGTCKKGAACIFAHELILSQLPGVYTFCRNFQNSVCSFPKCKFVHATVFEKEYFFRTGYLPPHTLAHLKEGNVAQPPPPPPPPEEVPVEVPPVYTGATIQPVIQCIPPVPVVYNPETPTVEPNNQNIVAVTTANGSPKREWQDNEDPGRLIKGAARDLNSGIPPAKKCKSCPTVTFRLEMMQNKIESVGRVNSKLQRDIALVSKKHTKLKQVLTALARQGNAPKPPMMLGSSTKEGNLMANNNKNEIHQVLKLLMGDTAPDNGEVDRTV